MEEAGAHDIFELFCTKEVYEFPVKLEGLSVITGIWRAVNNEGKFFEVTQRCIIQICDLRIISCE